MLHLDPLSKNIPSKRVLLLKSETGGPDDELMTKPRKKTRKEITAWPSVLF
jgi:hypothetical protein